MELELSAPWLVDGIFSAEDIELLADKPSTPTESVDPDAPVINPDEPETPGDEELGDNNSGDNSGEVENPDTTP